jgi:hypothetical protein
MKAFPYSYKDPNSGLFHKESGLDIRDYIAIQILGHLIQCSNLDLGDSDEDVNDWMEQNVLDSFKYADLYLTHREAQK